MYVHAQYVELVVFFFRYLDFVQIMNYDFHMYSKREPFTGFNAPLFKKFYEFFAIGKMNSVLNYLNQL